MRRCRFLIYGVHSQSTRLLGNSSVFLCYISVLLCFLFVCAYTVSKTETISLFLKKRKTNCPDHVAVPFILYCCTTILLVYPETHRRTITLFIIIHMRFHYQISKMCPNTSWFTIVLLMYFICSVMGQSTTTSALPKEVIKQIKSTLLPLLGFKDRPTFKTDNVEIPPEMKKIYEKQTGFHLDTASIPMPGIYAQSANTVRSFTHIESPIDQRFKGHHKFRLKFNITTVPKEETMMAAELKLKSKLSDGNTKKEYQRIVINDIIKPGLKGKYGPITRVIDTKLINTKMNRTLSLNVLPAVKRWLENPSTNYGLLILIYEEGNKKIPTKTHVRLRRAIDENDKDWSIYQPLLLTYTDDGKNKQNVQKIRKRRAYSRGGHRKGDQRDPCKRRSMYVNFQDVGWSDWIVAPLGFEAFYCGGECEYPMAEHMNTTNHAIVQSLINSARPHLVPKPCCVPTQLSSMSMLYVDSQKSVILKNYKDMVVIGCGCR